MWAERLDVDSYPEVWQWSRRFLTSLERDVASTIATISAQIAPYFERALTTKSPVSGPNVLPYITLELCALYVHLLDADAIAGCKCETREFFLKIVVDALADELERRFATAQEDFVDLWNDRHREYSAYKQILPRSAKESLAGTLFWEFGKKLGFKYHGYNFVGVQLFALAATDGYISLKRALYGQAPG